MDYYKINLHKIIDGKIFPLKRTDIVSKAMNFSTSKLAENKLKTIIIKYREIILDMINNFYNINLCPENLFFVSEFTVTGVGRIDLLFLTNYGNIIVTELKIQKNINNDPIEQILGYVRGIRNKTGEDLIRKIKDKHLKLFQKFICDNNIDEKILLNKINDNLKKRNILALLILNEVNKKIIERFDCKINDYKDDISCNIILAEIISYLEENSAFIIPYIHRKISLYIKIEAQNILSDLHSDIACIKNDMQTVISNFDTVNNNINNTLDPFHTHLHIISENSDTIKCLKKLIISEGIRLHTKSFNSLFKQKDLNSNIPSRSKCYSMLGSKNIADISKLFRNYSNNTKENIINSLKNLALKLGRSPSGKECKNNAMSGSTIKYYFGTYNNALKEAGLSPFQQRRKKPTKDEIKQEIITLSKSVKKQVVREYLVKGGRYRWYLYYFGSFENALKCCGVI